MYPCAYELACTWALTREVLVPCTPTPNKDEAAKDQVVRSNLDNQSNEGEPKLRAYLWRCGVAAKPSPRESVTPPHVAMQIAYKRCLGI